MPDDSRQFRVSLFSVPRGDKAHAPDVASAGTAGALGRTNSICQWCISTHGLPGRRLHACIPTTGVHGSTAATGGLMQARMRDVMCALSAPKHSHQSLSCTVDAVTPFSLLFACTHYTKASMQPTGACSVSAIHSPCLPSLRCCCGSRWACSASAAAATTTTQQGQHMCKCGQVTAAAHDVWCEGLHPALSRSQPVTTCNKVCKTDIPTSHTCVVGHALVCYPASIRGGSWVRLQVLPLVADAVRLPWCAALDDRCQQGAARWAGSHACTLLSTASGLHSSRQRQTIWLRQAAQAHQMRPFACCQYQNDLPVHARMDLMPMIDPSASQKKSKQTRHLKTHDHCLMPCCSMQTGTPAHCSSRNSAGTHVSPAPGGASPGG